MNENENVIIQGIGGIGKTRLAIDCIKHVQQKHANECRIHYAIIWIDSRELQYIEETFYDHIAKYFELSLEKFKDKDKFLDNIKTKLENSALIFYFVFDSLHSYDYIRSFVHNIILKPQKFKLIITTRDESQFKAQLSFKYIKIEMMNEKEAMAYCKNNFQDLEIRDILLIEFLRNFFGENNENKILPLMLRLVVSLYNQDKIKRLNDEMKQKKFRKQINLELATTFLIDDLDVNSPEMILLKIVSYLDGSQISYDLIIDIFNGVTDQQLKEIDDLANELCKRKLINIFTKDYSSYFSMHELIQDIIRDYGGQESDFKLKQTIVKAIEKKFPETTASDKGGIKEDEIDRVLKHALKVESADFEISHEKLKLCEKMGDYYLAKHNFKREVEYRYKELKMIGKLKINDACLTVDFNLSHLTTLEAKAHKQIGNAFNKLNDYYRAIESYQKSIDISSTDEKSIEIVSSNLNNMGTVYCDLGDYEKARECHQKSLEIKLRISPNHPQIANNYNNMGIVCYCLGKYDQALENYKQSLDIRSKKNPVDDSIIAESYNNIGNVYLELNMSDLALENHKLSLKIREKIHDAKHPSIATSYTNMGEVFMCKGDYNKALDLFQQSLDIRQKAYAQNHSLIAQTHENFGNVYMQLKEYDKALENYVKSFDIKKPIYSSKLDNPFKLENPNPNMAVSYGHIGHAQLNQSNEKLEEASENLLKSIRMHEKIFLNGHPNISKLYHYMSRVCDRQQNVERAQKWSAMSKKVFGDFFSEENQNYEKFLLKPLQSFY